MKQGETLTVRFEQLNNFASVAAIKAEHGLDVDNVISTIYPDAARFYDRRWKEYRGEPVDVPSVPHQRQQEAFAPSVPRPQTGPYEPPAVHAPGGEPGRIPTPRKYFLYDDMRVLTTAFLDGRGADGITDPQDRARKLRELEVRAKEEQRQCAEAAEQQRRGLSAQFCHSQEWARRDYEAVRDALTYAAQKNGYPLNII